MMRSNGIGTLLVALSWAGLVYGQQPRLPQPAGQPPMLPATTGQPGMLPTSAAPAAPLPDAVSKPPVLPVPVSPNDVIITVDEPGKPSLRCKVLKVWHMPDGMLAREVQALDTGEIMTIADGGVVQHHAPPPAPRSPGLASRLFHWGHDDKACDTTMQAQGPAPNGPCKPARGTQMAVCPCPSCPPGATCCQTCGPCATCEAPSGMNANSRTTPVPTTAVLAQLPYGDYARPKVQSSIAGAAQPSDWHQSWGDASDHPATVTPRPESGTASVSVPVSQPLPPATVTAVVIPKPDTTADTMVPPQPVPPPPSFPTEVTPKPAPSTSNYVPVKPALPPAPSYSTGVPPKPAQPPATYNVNVPSRPLMPPLDYPTKSAVKKTDQPPANVVAQVTPKTEPPPAKPTTVTATVKNTQTDLPQAAQRPDPLKDPQSFSKRPLDVGVTASKTTEDRTRKADDKTKPAAPAPATAAAPPAAAPPAVPPVATRGPSVPAGTQSVLAAQGGAPGNVVYLPVPVVTLPSGYRPQPQAPQIPRPPQPMPPAPPSDPKTIVANAFTPTEQEMAPMAPPVMAMAPGERNAFMPPPPPPGSPAAAAMSARGNGQGYPGAMGPMGYAPAWQGPMNAGMYPPAGYPPMPRAMNMPNPYVPGTPAAPGPVAGNAMGSGIVPVSYQTPAAPAPMPMPSSAELRPTMPSGPFNPAMLMVLHDSLYPSQREWAAENLSTCDWRSNPQVVPALVTAAREDAAPTVRVACIHYLARMNANSAPVLAALLQLKGDPDPRVRAEAEKAWAFFCGQPSRATASIAAALPASN